jgi:hypothetical protein
LEPVLTGEWFELKQVARERGPLGLIKVNRSHQG